MLQVPSSLVSVTWLHDHLSHPDLIVLNGTLGEQITDSMNIPTARVFDIKNKFSDTDAPFPNTFPSEELFTSEARLLGINNDSCIVVYDEKGIYSSARVWWMFKAFGHHNVAVLDGGLPNWEQSGYTLEKLKPYNGDKGDFTAKYNSSYMTFFNEMEQIVDKESHTVLDARSEDRFLGLVEESRNGLRSGHIPNSKNLPFESLMHQGKFHHEDELKKRFQAILKEDQKPLVFSCGSGITACILALGAHLSGLDMDKVSVYDGSWTEWGTLSKD